MIVSRIKSARKAGVPLVWLTTPDQPGMISTLRAGWNGTPPPMVGWNMAEGLTAINRPGQDLVAAVTANHSSLGLNLSASLTALRTQAPDDTIVTLSMSDQLLLGDHADQPAVQAILNLRDEFKATRRTLVCLAEGTKMPSVLGGDFLPLEDLPPTEQGIGQILDELLDAARGVIPLEEPDALTRDATIASLIGLHGFPIEQAISLSLKEHGKLVPADLQARKRAIVRQIPGLSMPRPDLPLSCLGGLAQVKGYADLIFTGTDAPKLIVIIEEIEKALAGVGHESSGTTDDQVGVLLTAMEDNHWKGLVAAGPPGSGKSQFAKSLGPTYGVPVFVLDLGGAKGGIVGQSEQQIRKAIAMISTMGRGSVMFVASCNSLRIVPPALRRRFTFGIWYFDLPNDDEKGAIWPIQLAHFGLPLDAPRPDDRGWTGAEIRNVCEMAASFRRTPAECAQYIAPVSESDPESIAQLRSLAVGRWLNASAPGRYTLPETSRPAAGRKFEA